MGFVYIPDGSPVQSPGPMNSAAEAKAWAKFWEKQERKRKEKDKDKEKKDEKEVFYFLGYEVKRNKKKESKISPAMMCLILMAFGPFVGAVFHWADNALSAALQAH